MFKFNGAYFRWALLLVGVEIVIGRWLHDALIRPYGGDFLVVILLYCAGRSVLRAAPRRVAGAVLLVAYATEMAQYFKLLARLGWQGQPWARLLLGSHFAWLDLLAYTLGAAAVLGIERARFCRQLPSRAVLVQRQGKRLRLGEGKL